MTRVKRLGIDLGAPAVAGAVLYTLIGTPAVALTLIASLLWLAWRYDNAAGTFLPLAVSFLLICAVLCAVLVLIVVVHAG